MKEPLNKSRINVAAIKPWWFRLFLLIIIGVPPFTRWPISRLEDPSSPIINIAIWLGYACFIWLFIFLSTGIDQFLKFVAPAFVIAFTTAFSGAIIVKLFPFLSGGKGSPYKDLSYDMTILLVIIMSVVPYALLVVNSFSFYGIISKVSSKAGKRKGSFLLHLALMGRVLQHVGEVFSNLFLVWVEENPKILSPRFKKDWRYLYPHKKLISFIYWLYISLKAWCMALLMHTFEILPFYTDGFYRIKK